MFFYSCSHLAFRYQVGAGGANFGPLWISWENLLKRKYNFSGFVPPSDNLYICPLTESRKASTGHLFHVFGCVRTVSLPGRCLTTFLKSFNDGDSITSSGALYLEKWKTALDVNHGMNINWKCLWRQICLISWDINIYCWCQSFGQRETILSFPQDWNKFKPNHIVMSSMIGMLLISFLPVLKRKLSGLLPWFIMR